MRSRIMLIPRLASHWWEAFERPHRLLDQHFGHVMRPENFFNSSLLDRRISAAYSRFLEDFARDDFFRDIEKQGFSQITADKDKFNVSLDVQQFKPEEINVKIVDNCFVVEGKHEEKQDDHGTISRHFVRKYLIPEECDPEKASTSLSSDGILTISAPVKPDSILDKYEKQLKIEHTGKPVLEKLAEGQSQKQDESPSDGEEPRLKVAQKQ